jgi:hypothetical protein
MLGEHPTPKPRDLAYHSGPAAHMAGSGILALVSMAGMAIPSHPVRVSRTLASKLPCASTRVPGSRIARVATVLLTTLRILASPSPADANTRPDRTAKVNLLPTHAGPSLVRLLASPSPADPNTRPDRTAKVTTLPAPSALLPTLLEPEPRSSLAPRRGAPLSHLPMLEH